MKTVMYRNVRKKARALSFVTLSSHWCRWIVIISLASGCAYQIWRFYQLYSGYPVVVDVQLQYRSKIEIPAITICNDNGIRRRYYCSKFPEKCYKVYNSTKFCERYPNYCIFVGDGNEELLMPDLSKMENGTDQRFYMEFGHVRENMILSSRLMARSRHLVQRSVYELPNFNLKGNVQSCVIMYSQIFSKVYDGESKPLVNIETEPFSSMSLAVDFEPEEYVNPNEAANGLMVVQSPFALLNPSIFGIKIRPGYNYYVNVKPIEKHLLPAPYRTNCSKDDKNPSWEVCVLKCSIQEMMNTCGCVEKEIFYPHNYPICFKPGLCKKDIRKMCNKNCPLACHSMDFEINAEEMEYFEDWKTRLKRKLPKLENQSELIKKRTAVIKIYIPRPEVMVYKYSPKFEGIELFSYLGGYIGIWLGISLASVYEFFIESVKWIIKSYTAGRKRTKVIRIPVASKMTSIY